MYRYVTEKVLYYQYFQGISTFSLKPDWADRWAYTSRRTTFSDSSRSSLQIWKRNFIWQYKSTTLCLPYSHFYLLASFSGHHCNQSFPWDSHMINESSLRTQQSQDQDPKNKYKVKVRWFQVIVNNRADRSKSLLPL